MKELEMTKQDYTCLTCNTQFVPKKISSSRTPKYCKRECYDKARMPTQSEFISRCKKAHGDRYDYSETVYSGFGKNVRIRCRSHGFFEQASHVHIKGSGCPDCAGVRKITLDVFLERAKLKHGDKYSYEHVSFSKVTEKISIYCNNCGSVFSQAAYDHLKGNNCNVCTRGSSYDTSGYIERAVSAHGNKYCYQKTFFQKATDKVVITCLKHGDFIQDAASHLRGHGCPKCASPLQGWGRQNYVDACQSNNGMSAIYLIKCKGDDELFYKIGVTSIGLKQRFKSSEMPYDYEPIFFIEGEAGYIWDLELSLQRINKRNKYIPRLGFDGYTECFSTISKGSIRLLKSIKETDQLQLIA